MHSLFNIRDTTTNNLCTGCGVCEDVCPKNCIAITRLNGELRPIVDEEKCLGENCGRCLKVCPGVGTNLKKLAEDRFAEEGVKVDSYIGRYIALHSGYSLDNDIRYHSASGGIVSQFIIFLLEKKIIDGAVVTAFAEDRITPRSYIARTKEEVLAARSSKYCPVSLNKIGNEIVANEGKYVIVGQPCHIQGFRKRMAIDKRLRERVLGLFAVYCSSGRTYNSQDYLFKHYKINKKDISYFAYRDNGCLGDMIIQREDTSDRLNIPFSHYYGPMLRSFFIPDRCLMCVDHYGELADVSFGDIHIPPYSEDKIGVSSWITRSHFWEQLFHQAADEGFIKMDDLDADTLNRSQAVMLYPKKQKAQALMNLYRIAGRKIVHYDKDLGKPNLRHYIRIIICKCQQFIGKRKKLWFIIEIINKNK